MTVSMKDFRSSGTASQGFGVKMLVYGGAGCGKTPMMTSSPRPVCLITEPGTLSLRGSNIPIYEAFTAKAIDEFFEWVFSGSDELKNFDTICVDSVSQMAETYLKEAQRTVKDGRAVYGQMARNVMKWLDALYYMREKHVYLVGKQMGLSDTNLKYCTYFPGNELLVKVPHLYDIVIYMNRQIVAGQGVTPIPVLNTLEGFNFVARDRSGKLAELEAPNLDYVFKKVMS